MRLRTGVLLAAAAALVAAGQPAIASFAGQPPVVVSEDPSDLTPNVLDGQVNAIVQVGERVLVGGTFTRVQQAGSADVLMRSSLFAYDSATGAIDASFAPALNGEVEALELDAGGAAVFVGGAFSTVNGKTARKLAKLSVTTGVPVAGFAAPASAVVQDLSLRGSRLYASGKFTTIGGAARSGLARLNPATGAVDPTLNVPFSGPAAGTMGVPEIDVSSDGSRLVAVGNFSTVGGLARSQLAVLDIGGATASVTPWHTDRYPTTDPEDPAMSWCLSKFSTYLRDVAFSPDGSWFVVTTAGGNRPGKLCDTAARWETAPSAQPAQPTWVATTGGDSLTAVGVTEGAVYIGGHQQYVNNPYVASACGVCPGPAPGGVARPGIAALDPLNGLPFSWNPGRDRGVGVYAFTESPDGLLVGSDTERLGGELHARLGLFPAAGGQIVAPATPYTLPGDLYSANDQLRRSSYDLTTLTVPEVVPGMPDFTDVRGAFALGGKLYTGNADGTLSVRAVSRDSAGAPKALDLHGLETAPDAIFMIPGTELPIPSLTDQLRNTTGMFYDRGRLYYTVAGEPRLYYRWFTPQSGIVGAELFVAATGEQWAGVRGMTMASGRLLYASADGDLWQAPFDGGTTGTAARVGGPTLDGTNWASRALFVLE